MHLVGVLAIAPLLLLACAAAVCSKELELCDDQTDCCSGTICHYTRPEDSIGTCRPDTAFDDPQFIGLDARKFTFDGLPDECFALLSEQGHQLNALFVEGPKRQDVLGAGTSGTQTQGTYIGGFGLLAYNTRVEILVDKHGNMTVMVDGRAMADELKPENGYKCDLQTDHENNVSVRVEMYRRQTGHTVTVFTPLFSFTIYGSWKRHDAVLNQTLRGHLNMVLGVDLPRINATAVHGILASPPFRDVHSVSWQLDIGFMGDGVMEDYIVSGLLEHDFKYDRFTHKQPKSLPTRFTQGRRWTEAHVKSL